jgi:diguanylate cyclase (GGDEF)-like protein
MHLVAPDESNGSAFAGDHHADGDAEIAGLLADARRQREARPRAALAASERAAELAAAAGDEPHLAWANQLAGSAWHDLGDLEQSADLLDAALARFERLGDGHGVASSLNLLGVLEIDRGNLERAHELLVAAIGRFRALASRPEEAVASYNLGKIFYRLGDPAAALEHYLACAAIEADLAPPGDRALTLGSIAAIHRQLGDYLAAAACLERALDLLEPEGDGLVRATTLAEQGLTLGHLGRFDEALGHLDAAISIALACDSPARLRDVRLVLAEVRSLQADHIAALAAARSAHELSRSLGDRFVEARALLLMGQARQMMPDDDATDDLPALDRFRAALAIGNEVGALYIQRDAHEGLARAFEHSGEITLALRHLKALLAAERRIFDEESDRRTRGLTMRYETDRARKEAEIQRLRNVELALALDRLAVANRQSEELLTRLQEQARLLEQQATEDPLTGLANRRRFDGELERELERAARFGHPFSLALLDIDHFKAVNDRYSHQTGDRVLQTLASLLRGLVRDVDLVARIGGEEFAILFPETDEKRSVRAVERIRRTVERHQWGTIEPGLTVTLSGGVSAIMGAGEAQVLLAAADRSLYEAKRRGRNRVVQASSVVIAAASAAQ